MGALRAGWKTEKEACRTFPAFLGALLPSTGYQARGYQHQHRDLKHHPLPSRYPPRSSRALVPSSHTMPPSILPAPNEWAMGLYRRVPTASKPRNSSD